MNKPRAKVLALKAAVLAFFYGGTLGAGLGFYRLLGDDADSTLGILAVLAVAFTVAELIDMLLNVFVGDLTGRLEADATKSPQNASQPDRT